VVAGGGGTPDGITVARDAVTGRGRASLSIRATSPSDQGGGKAPIGADVVVAAPSGVAISVSATIVPAVGFIGTDVIASVETAVEEYITELGIGEDVIYVHIANIIHDTVGVDNYSSLTVNASSVDITIDPDETATVGTTTIVE